MISPPKINCTALTIAAEVPIKAGFTKSAPIGKFNIEPPAIKPHTKNAIEASVLDIVGFSIM